MSSIIQNDELDTMNEQEEREGTVGVPTTETAEVHYIRYDSQKKRIKPRSTSNYANQQERPKKQCFRCGVPWTRDHLKDCKAIKSTCNNCKRVGHYAKCCKSTKKVYVQNTSRADQNELSLYTNNGVQYADIHVLSSKSEVHDKDMNLTFKCVIQVQDHTGSQPDPLLEAEN